MPTLTFTNQLASQALRGQTVTVSLDAAESADLSQLSVGMKCQATLFSNFGYIQSIDSFGHSFKVTPVEPDKYFGSEGYLQELETITVTL